MTLNILVCYGTRPEYIKISPLLTEFTNQGIKFKTLCIQQHTSLLNNVRPADYTVAIPSAENRLNGILSAGMGIPEEAFTDVTHVLVQGDTATAFLGAITAFNRRIDVIHLEAGLRTYDRNNPYPEEIYRQMISRIAQIHLCPTEQNKQNLINEKVFGEFYVVGNTVLDNLKILRGDTEYGNEVLVTLHRRENHALMEQWFSTINSIARDNPSFLFTLPIHPNPNVQIYKHLLTHVNVVEPIEYDSFIKKLLKCSFVISDSGGIQEEAGFLGKKVIVCRTTTERQEGLGSFAFLCPSPADLTKFVINVVGNLQTKQSDVYGSGNSTKLVVASIIENYLGKGNKL